MSHTCGEKPGIGSYRCRKCGETIHLDQNSDALPPCPRCNACSWDKN